MVGATIYPYLSIVIPGRNDNYGGEQRERLNFCCAALLEQLEHFRIESEIVLVDYNPPPDRPPFSSLIDWPAKTACCSVRAITVAPEFHARFLHSDKRSFNGPTSFNVGFRRSRGLFIVPKSSDTIFSDELMQFLAQKRLEIGRVYRANRCDVPKELLHMNGSLAQKLAFCHRNIITEYGYQNVKSPFPILHTNASGDFQMMYRDHLFAIHGYWERDVCGTHNDSLVQYAAYCLGISEARLPPPARVFKITHDRQTTRTVTESAPKQALRDGVPTLSWAEAFEVIQEMVLKKRSPILSDESWGLADVDLPEQTIVKAGAH